MILLTISSLQVGGGRQPVKYVDCIPMLHINTGLAPMAEVALAQVQSDDTMMIVMMIHDDDRLSPRCLDVV